MNLVAIGYNIASAVHGAIFAGRVPGSTGLRCNPWRRLAQGTIAMRAGRLSHG
jgi:hypothetical protein